MERYFADDRQSFLTADEFYLHHVVEGTSERAAYLSHAQVPLAQISHVLVLPAEPDPSGNDWSEPHDLVVFAPSVEGTYRWASLRFDSWESAYGTLQSVEFILRPQDSLDGIYVPGFGDFEL